MSSHPPFDDSPLPPRAREDFAAFRDERPSDELMGRVRDALAAAERGEGGHRSPSRSETSRVVALRPAHLAFTLTAFAAAAMAIVGMRVRASSTDLAATHATAALAGAPSSVQVTVRLAGEGPTWVHLPARLAEHGSSATTVHIDVPATQAQHAEPALGDAHLPRTCMGALCSHRVVAEVGSGRVHEPLRVRIHQPGRYEFRVTHASHAHMQHDHFVVLATR